jgi:hypothetical protein
MGDTAAKVLRFTKRYGQIPANQGQVPNYTPLAAGVWSGYACDGSISHISTRPLRLESSA